VAKSYDQVFQVGTWQRSDWQFRKAVEMVAAGRIGKLHTVTCATDANPTGGPFESRIVPKHLNWNLWLGQAPLSDYTPERCHYTFRWWHEYAGGKVTDWGAHHIDIAQWAIDSMPTQIVTRGEMPNLENGYNVAKRFEADVTYQNGVRLAVRDSGRRGILFEGDQGRIFVNRGILDGAPVKAMSTNPLEPEDFRKYADDNLDRPQRTGKLDAIINHMGNFFDCVESRKTPISDIESQHRSATTCHLINISLRLGQDLRWNAKAEECGDARANAMLSREQRKGFEVIA
ncbi:MAG: gfo/Idh/MocA family oxidoreductase, partial [Planctomycetota bacterium]